MKYNKDQWISSFEDAVVKARPHMPAKLLTTMAVMAWNKHGTRGDDPHEAAREWLKPAPGKEKRASSSRN